MTRAEIQFIRSLSDKKARTESGLFIVEGDKLIEEVVHSHFEVEAIFSTNDTFKEFGSERVSPKEMERISQLKSANSSLALVKIPQYELDMGELQQCLSLALDDVQNPGNLGTIIRIADWFGVRDILCSKSSADFLNSKVVQATMGAITRVRVHYTDLEGVLGYLGSNSTPIYGTYMDGANIYSTELKTCGVVVMGNEGHGISKGVERYVTDRIAIPAYSTIGGGSESLNVGVATGIICAEFRRQESKK